ncbi:MAG TPA: helix-turn-helix transcriptional regulator [Solirubrobacteraceae bacterium]|nr:helix-turn-helix transcriptional regulator [Solirubrobacteraceae bacterium]
MEDHPPSQAFGQAAREIRKERGLSQEEAVLKGEIDRAYYGHIERATKSATLRTIWKMAAALGVPPSALFTRAEQILEQDEKVQPRPAR